MMPTLKEIMTSHPKWTNKVAVEAWLAECYREAGGYAPDDLFEGLTPDANGEFTVTEEQAAAIIAKHAR